jgi:hypothetical protein
MLQEICAKLTGELNLVKENKVLKNKLDELTLKTNAVKEGNLQLNNTIKEQEENQSVAIESLKEYKKKYHMTVIENDELSAKYQETIEIAAADNRKLVLKVEALERKNRALQNEVVELKLSNL